MDYGQGNAMGQLSGSLANAKMVAAPNTRDSVQSASADLGRQVERVAKLAEHLRMVADRIEGGRPEPVAGQGNESAAIPHSLLADLRSKNNSLSTLLGACEDQAMRLTAALGIQL